MTKLEMEWEKWKSDPNLENDEFEFFKWIAVSCPSDASCDGYADCVLCWLQEVQEVQEVQE